MISVARDEGKKTEGDEKWQEREGRAVSVADGGFRRSALRVSCDSQANIMVVAVPDTVGVLAERGREVAAAQSFDDLLGRLAPLGTRPTSDHKKKEKKRTKSPLQFHRRRLCGMAFASREFRSQRRAWQVPGGEQGPSHAL